MDSNSTWNVTADSFITSITDMEGVSGTTIKNITDNGFTVYYDPAACPDLNHQVFTLQGGGYLKPMS